MCIRDSSKTQGRPLLNTGWIKAEEEEELWFYALYYFLSVGIYSTASQKRERRFTRFWGVLCLLLSSLPLVLDLNLHWIEILRVTDRNLIPISTCTVILKKKWGGVTVRDSKLCTLFHWKSGNLYTTDPQPTFKVLCVYINYINIYRPILMHTIYRIH